MAAPILWAPGKMVFFAGKTHAHKIPRFRGMGVFWVLGGEGADIVFMGARIFLKEVRILTPQNRKQKMRKMENLNFASNPGNRGK